MDTMCTCTHDFVVVSNLRLGVECDTIPWNHDVLRSYEYGISIHTYFNCHNNNSYAEMEFCTGFTLIVCV